MKRKQIVVTALLLLTPGGLVAYSLYKSFKLVKGWLNSEAK